MCVLHDPCVGRAFGCPSGLGEERIGHRLLFGTGEGRGFAELVLEAVGRQPHGRRAVRVAFHPHQARQFLSAATQVPLCAPATQCAFQEGPDAERYFAQLRRRQSAQSGVLHEQDLRVRAFDLRLQHQLVGTEGPCWIAAPADFEDGQDMALTPATEVRGDALDAVCLVRRGEETACLLHVGQEHDASCAHPRERVLQRIPQGAVPDLETEVGEKPVEYVVCGQASTVQEQGIGQLFVQSCQKGRLPRPGRSAQQQHRRGLRRVEQPVQDLKLRILTQHLRRPFPNPATQGTCARRTRTRWRAESASTTTRTHPRLCAPNVVADAVRLPRCEQRAGPVDVGQQDYRVPADFHDGVEQGVLAPGINRVATDFR